LDDLAGLKLAENKPAEAASLYEQSLAMMEKIAGPESPDLAPHLSNLATAYEFTKDKQKAEPLFLRAISLDEKALGADSPDLATDLNNLGMLYLFSKRYQEAATTLGRALTIERKAFGDSDPVVKQTLESYNSALRALKQSAQSQ
jgi:tetratricopeptide (TPR) repeat protein